MTKEFDETPWLRQKWEKKNHYSYYLGYFKQPVRPRTLVGGYRHYIEDIRNKPRRTKKKIIGPPQYYRVVYQDNRWEWRVAQYERHMEIAKQNAEIEASQQIRDDMKGIAKDLITMLRIAINKRAKRIMENPDEALEIRPSEMKHYLSVALTLADTYFPYETYQNKGLPSGVPHPVIKIVHASTETNGDPSDELSFSIGPE